MNFQERIQNVKAKLTPVDWEIFSYLENHQSQFSHLTLQDVAKHCHVSTTTIFRFCQKLQLSGFSELKALLKNQNVEMPDQSSLSQGYHQIVDSIHHYDTRTFFRHLAQKQEFYLLAETEKELRVAKEIQRIYQQANFKVFILPSQKAFETILPQLSGALLWFIKIDSTQDFPAAYYQPTVLENNYKIIMTYPSVLHVLFDDMLFIPKIWANSSQAQEDLLTPFILAAEYLYLKFQLGPNHY